MVQRGFEQRNCRFGFVERGKGAAQRMINVVNDIIDYSKAEAECLPLSRPSPAASTPIKRVFSIGI